MWQSPRPKGGAIAFPGYKIRRLASKNKMGFRQRRPMFRTLWALPMTLRRQMPLPAAAEIRARLALHGEADNPRDLIAV